MGDSEIFSKANLDLIAGPNPGQTPLRLSDIIHKSQIVLSDSEDFTTPKPICMQIYI